MEYSRIVAVTGMPGLYEVLSSKTDGAVVRSLEEGTTKFVSSRVHNLTHLESIEIYTTGENVTLSDVLGNMKGSNEALPDVKDSKALKSYFEKVYPEIDFDRVYASDMKKIVSWFKVIQANDIDFTVKTAPEEGENEEETNEVTADKAEPVTATATEGEAKPKKTRKKKTEEE